MSRSFTRWTLPAVVAAAVCAWGIAAPIALGQVDEYETTDVEATGDATYYEGEYVDQSDIGPVEEIYGAAPAHAVHPAISRGYYTPAHGGVPAAMYPSPRPIAIVPGSVYYTYEPFMPHELMYRHYSCYKNHYGTPDYHGLLFRPTNRTSVLWTYGAMRKTIF